jgi:hypothetical protein
MPYNPSSRVMNISRSIQPSKETQTIIQRLTVLATNGLVPMFYPDKQLFCHRLNQTEGGLVREGISHRYTCMTLMGLHRLELTGVPSPIAIKPSLDALLADTAWVNNIGDLGVLIWTLAVVAPERLAEVESRLDLKNALNRFPDVQQGHTMELAWFLTGLCHRQIACQDTLPDMKDQAVKTYEMLKNNQGERGIFGHIARNKSVAGKIRGVIGSFADQVYPIYGMTKYWEAYGDKNAVERALECALTICEAQGPLGQWWWHYNSSTGQVIDGFPVFSVHQHGMAPMVLLALGEAIQSDFGPWIYKGLEWIAKNELDFNMEDESKNLVWRSIYRPRASTYWNTAIALMTKSGDRGSLKGMKVRYECRPYELGWLLYAFANWTADNK